MRGWIVAAWGLLVLAVAGCAMPVTDVPQVSQAATGAEVQRQRELLLDRMMDEEDRLFGVTWPILAANAEICGQRVQPSSGFVAETEEAFAEDVRAAAREQYGVGDNFVIISTAPGSPAAEAGVQRGDEVLAVDGADVTGRRTGDFADAIDAAVARRGRYDLRLDRKGTVFEVTLRPIPTCAYTFAVDAADSSINASSGRDDILLAHGMMRFAETDDELAIVVGHELGHIVMRHTDKRLENASTAALGGLVVDVLMAAGGVDTGGAAMRDAAAAGGRAYSVDFEREADYVGLYFTARAGYAVGNAADFWRRMGSEGPSSIDRATSHPPSAERSLALEATTAELLAKVRAGQPLIPDLRPEG